MGAMIAIYIGVTLISLFLRAAGKLRLGIPLLYIILLCTVLREWANKNETLVIVIFGVFMGLVIASWITTIVRAFRSSVGSGKQNKAMEDVLLQQIHMAQAKGVPVENIRVNNVGGVPIVDYDRD